MLCLPRTGAVGWSQEGHVEASVVFYFFWNVDVDGSACWFDGLCGGWFFYNDLLKYFKIKIFLSMGSAILWFCRNPGSAIYVLFLRLSRSVSQDFRFLPCTNRKQHKWLLVKAWLSLIHLWWKTRQQFKRMDMFSTYWHMISKKCSLYEIISSISFSSSLPKKWQMMPEAVDL